MNEFKRKIPKSNRERKPQGQPSRESAVPNDAATRKRRRKIKVGDHVIRDLGTERFPAEVVEDRGFIGRGGRQLVTIRRLGVSPELALPYEVPAEELEIADDNGAKQVRRAYPRQRDRSGA